MAYQASEHRCLVQPKSYQKRHRCLDNSPRQCRHYTCRQCRRQVYSRSLGRRSQACIRSCCTPRSSLCPHCHGNRTRLRVRVVGHESAASNPRCTHSARYDNVLRLGRCEEGLQVLDVVRIDRSRISAASDAGGESWRGALDGGLTGSQMGKGET